MICPECGSYQPDRAKYCGICGAGLSQAGLVESFLKGGSEQDIILPRHRGVLFYLVVSLVILAGLAAVAGAGYLVYRIAWGHDKAPDKDGRAVEAPHIYTDPELGFTITYPNGWSIDAAAPGQDELAALIISFTPRKAMDLRALQLDPLVSIGGIEAIEEHLEGVAAARISALGGELGFGPSGGAAQEREGARQPGDGAYDEAEGAPSGEPDPGDTAAVDTAAGESVTPSDTAAGESVTPGDTTPGEPIEPGGDTADDPGGDEAQRLFNSTSVSGLPAFYAEFSANYMGEETRFLLFYIVAGDYIFAFQGRAPYGEFKDVRPQFFAITGSFKYEMDSGELTPTKRPL